MEAVLSCELCESIVERGGSVQIGGREEIISCQTNLMFEFVDEQKAMQEFLWPINNGIVSFETHYCHLIE